MTELVELVVHENGIHEFIFHDNSRAVAEVYFDMLNSLLEALTDDQTQVLTIVNLLESGMPPFAQMTRHAREMAHRHRDQMAQVHMKSVILMRADSKMMLSLINTFMQLMPIDIEMRGFGQSERDEALAWLTG